MILVEHNWLLYIAAFACAFAITLVTTPFAKWLSVKCGAIDYPKDRGVHKKPMPRMGGVAIVLGFTITVLMVNYFDKSMDSRQFAGFLVGALLIAGLGVVDDMKNLPAKLKFCVQILAALIVIFSGTRIQVVLWPVTAYLQKFSIPITLVWIVGVTNAVNLIDGLDGLAAGSSAIIGVALGILAYMSSHFEFASFLNIMFIPGAEELVVFAAAFIGATVGFLWYNSYPAQVFMGDTGSLTLGGIIAVFAIIIRKELLIPILCGIFLAESISVMAQVAYFKYTKKKYGEGRRIFKMTPLHHHFQKAGNAGIQALIQKPFNVVPESKIVVRFWLIGIILAVITIVTLKMR